MQGWETQKQYVLEYPESTDKGQMKVTDAHHFLASRSHLGSQLIAERLLRRLRGWTAGMCVHAYSRKKKKKRRKRERMKETVEACLGKHTNFF